MQCSDADARAVLARYGMGGAHIEPLGNAGGFSGARIWRIRADGEFCLKAWPPGAMDAARLGEVHALMRQAHDAGLQFISVPFAASDGSTCEQAFGRVWDLTTWMPGQADFHARPSARRLRAACIALAQLHLVWQYPQPVVQPFPAVHRRLAAARTWHALVGTGWRPDFRGPPDGPLTHWAARAWRAIDGRISPTPDFVGRLVDLRVEVQPCLCDIWHDHVLFHGDALSGLIDFGSVKLDHITVDLARMIGSLAGEDRALGGEGIDAYCSVRPLGFDALFYVLVLDRTGVLLGIANWLRWLYHEQRQYDDRAAVARRLAELVQRVERWQR